MRLPYLTACLALLLTAPLSGAEMITTEYGTYEGFVRSLNPTAYYTFDGDGSDSSGNGLNGTLVGSPSFTPGQAFAGNATGNQAVSFNGSSQYANLDVLVPELDHRSFSFSGWVNSTDTRGNRVLFAINNSAGSDNTLLMRVNANGSVRFEDISFATHDPFSPAGLNDGSWHHVAYVSDGSTGQFYLDGTSLGPQTIGLPNGTSLRYSLGQEYDGAGASDHFAAMYDSFAFFDRALSEAELFMLADTNAQLPMTPEPGSLALMGLGLAAAGVWFYKSRR